jgi:Na+-driven multidrug efflux pump
MRSLNARQAALGLLVATGLAAVAGFIASYIGIFGIFVGFIAGGFIAETVIRVIGYKRGPWIVAVVVVGIVAGTLLGFGLDNWMYYSQAIEAGVPPSEIGLTPMAILSDVGVWAVIVGGAMVVGAYTRLR